MKKGDLVMALPQDGQNANDLTKVTQIPAGKELMFIDPTTNEGGIITLEDLTKQILNGLASQAFALDAGQMTLPAALNYLYGNLGSHNTFYKNLGDDNNPLSSYDLTLKGGAKSDNEISYLIFIGDRGYSTFIKTPSLYIASGGVTYASVQRLILGSNSSIEASITKGNPFTVSFTGFAPKSSLLICIPLVRA